MGRKVRFITIGIAIAILGTGALVVFQRIAMPKTKTNILTTSTVPFSTTKDITYCSPENIPQKFDLYKPSNRSEQLVPLVIHIHGGSWNSGQKSSVDVIDYLENLATNGFAVASINYRLAPTYSFPTQLQDIKCAVRYFRSNANTYGLDANRIAVIGESAGGHLAALLATTADDRSFETAEYTGVSEQVKAVVDLFGPANLTSFQTYSPIIKNGIQTLLGTYPSDRASPTYYVRSNSPPFMIIHGEDDAIVPISQSKELISELQKANVYNQFISVKYAGHGLIATGSKPIEPSIETINSEIIMFLKRYLN